MIKYIVFDFDGTIADTFEVVREEGARILAPYRITLDVGEARRIGLKQAILTSGFPVQDIPKRLTQLRQAIQARIVRDVKAFPGMDRVLEGLAQRFTLAVLSSNAEMNIRGFLENNDLSRFFTIVYSGSSLFGKHRVFQRLCRKYGIERKELVYVGDEDRDIQASKRFGVKNIAVAWGYNTRERLHEERPDQLVAEVDELTAAINRLNAV